MKFARKPLIFSSLIMTAFLVCGCAKSDYFEHYVYISEIEDKHEDETFDNESYKKFGYYEPYQIKQNGEVLGRTSEVMRGKYGQKHYMNTTGDQKILVIPVDFSDYTVEDLGISKQEYIENLNKSFFGKSDNNEYVSVAEYFNVSSYGKLRLDGKVVDTFYTFKDKTVKELNEKPDRNLLINEYDKIIDWYVNELHHTDIDTFKVPGLTSKNIPIYLVYTYPIELNSETNDFFWAYTFDKVPLSWSSYSFLYTQYGKPDAHTFIHETGHLLGLRDYYPTEESTSTVTAPDPTARIDMMDCSIGDESSFSKMYLDWTRPYYVTKNTTISLKSFESSGEVILLSNDWNKTVFDEYYLIEFYTPTGLNTYDVNVGNSEAKLPSMPGIKIYHVDARLAWFNKDPRKETFLTYCNEGDITIDNNKIINIAHDNNTYSNVATEEEYMKNYLVELVQNNLEGRISGCATNGNLYHSGDEFTNFKFNNGKTLNCKIKINSLTYKETSISIEFGI